MIFAIYVFFYTDYIYHVIGFDMKTKSIKKYRSVGVKTLKMRRVKKVNRSEIN